MNTGDEFSQVTQCLLSEVVRGMQRRCSRGVACGGGPSHGQAGQQCDQLLLNAVVQISFDVAARCVFGLDESTARGGQLIDAGGELSGEIDLASHERYLAGAPAKDGEVSTAPTVMFAIHSFALGSGIVDVITMAITILGLALMIRPVFALCPEDIHSAATPETAAHA